MESRFIANKRRFTVTREQVETALRDVPPQKVRVWAVEVDGKLYPPAQAVIVTCGVDPDWNGERVARRVLRELGFTVSALGTRPRASSSRAAMRAALPKRHPGFGPTFDEFLELEPIHLQWYDWERWDDIAEHGLAIVDVPRHTPRVHEAMLEDEEERLTIGRTADLRHRVLNGLVRGTEANFAADKIRKHEDVHRIIVRWARTNRPAAAEEELHRRHIAQFGHLPKYTMRT